MADVTYRVHEWVHGRAAPFRATTDPALPIGAFFPEVAARLAEEYPTLYAYALAVRETCRGTRSAQRTADAERLADCLAAAERKAGAA